MRPETSTTQYEIRMNQNEEIVYEFEKKICSLLHETYSVRGTERSNKLPAEHEWLRTVGNEVENTLFSRFHEGPILAYVSVHPRSESGQSRLDPITWDLWQREGIPQEFSHIIGSTENHNVLRFQSKYGRVDPLWRIIAEEFVQRSEKGDIASVYSIMSRHLEGIPLSDDFPRPRRSHDSDRIKHPLYQAYVFTPENWTFPDYGPWKDNTSKTTPAMIKAYTSLLQNLHAESSIDNQPWSVLALGVADLDPYEGGKSTLFGGYVWLVTSWSEETVRDRLPIITSLLHRVQRVHQFYENLVYGEQTVFEIYSHEQRKLASALFGKTSGVIHPIKKSGLAPQMNHCFRNDSLICFVPEAMDILRMELLAWIGTNPNSTGLELSGSSLIEVICLVACKARLGAAYTAYITEIGAPQLAVHTEDWRACFFNFLKKNYIDPVPKSDESCISWKWLPRGNINRQMYFLRLMFAVWRNTFEHARPDRLRTFCFLRVENSHLYLKIENSQRGEWAGAASGGPGTKRVLVWCLDRLKGCLLDFPNPGQTRKCITEFKLPLNEIFFQPGR
jgi:hypothetical protein